MSEIRFCSSCDAPEAYDGEHETGDCLHNLREQRDRYKQELITALREIRWHSEYRFEKRYGTLAVELGIEHAFRWFPPQSDDTP